jgi:hypothetical protein
VQLAAAEGLEACRVPQNGEGSERDADADSSPKAASETPLSVAASERDTDAGES